MEKAQIDALEDCLERIQAGADLEQVLEQFPSWAGELRPLLEASVVARSLQSQAVISEKAMVHSRTLFIQKAAARQPKSRNIFKFGLRYNHTLAIGISAVLILAVATTIASAQSIPGDVFYPVKLAGEQTRLLLTSNQSSRLNLQATYDNTRTNEVEDILQAHRTVSVSFAGLLTHNDSGQWQVSGVPVTFASNLAPQLSKMMGAYVSIYGFTQGNHTVEVTQITLRELDITGTVDQYAGDNLVVDQITIHLDQNTETVGILQDGAYVAIKAYRIEDNTLMARQVLVVNSGQTATHAATQTNTITIQATDPSQEGDNPPAVVDPRPQASPTASPSKGSQGSGEEDGSGGIGGEHPPTPTATVTVTGSPDSATQSATATSTPPNHHEDEGSGSSQTTQPSPTQTQTSEKSYSDH